MFDGEKNFRFSSKKQNVCEKMTLFQLSFGRGNLTFFSLFKKAKNVDAFLFFF